MYCEGVGAMASMTKALDEKRVGRGRGAGDSELPVKIMPDSPDHQPRQMPLAESWTVITSVLYEFGVIECCSILNVSYSVFPK